MHDTPWHRKHCLCGGRGLCSPCRRYAAENEITAELDTRELVPYDDDCEPTLPDAGAETSHR